MCVLDMLYCGVLYVGMHVRMMSRLTYSIACSDSRDECTHAGMMSIAACYSMLWYSVLGMYVRM